MTLMTLARRRLGVYHTIYTSAHLHNVLLNNARSNLSIGISVVVSGSTTLHMAMTPPPPRMTRRRTHHSTLSPLTVICRGISYPRLHRLGALTDSLGVACRTLPTRGDQIPCNACTPINLASPVKPAVKRATQLTLVISLPCLSSFNATSRMVSRRRTPSRMPNNAG